jgi:hypothetical protein
MFSGLAVQVLVFYVYSSGSSSGQQQQTAAAHSGFSVVYVCMFSAAAAAAADNSSRQRQHTARKYTVGFQCWKTRIRAEARTLYTGYKQKQKELMRTEKNGSNGSE